MTHVSALAAPWRLADDGRAMDTERARTVAERLHAADREEDGTPLLAHIRRVALAVPPEARPVGWLHEALEDASSLRVEPHLRDHLARVVPRPPFQLEHGDWPEHREIVELEPSGSVLVVQHALLPGVELAQGSLAEQHLADRTGLGVALQPSRAHEPARYRVDFDAEPAETPDAFADLAGVERAQLDHRIAHTPLDPARAHDDARPVELKVGRIEEDHLPDLGIQRIEAERADRRTLLGGGDSELELDRIRAAQEAHHLHELRVGQGRANGSLCGHRRSLSAQ